MNRKENKVLHLNRLKMLDLLLFMFLFLGPIYEKILHIIFNDVSKNNILLEGICEVSF